MANTGKFQIEKNGKVFNDSYKVTRALLVRNKGYPTNKILKCQYLFRKIKYYKKNKLEPVTMSFCQQGGKCVCV